jgi:hypothetical protein
MDSGVTDVRMATTGMPVDELVPAPGGTPGAADALLAE